MSTSTQESRLYLSVSMDKVQNKKNSGGFTGLYSGSVHMKITRGFEILKWNYDGRRRRRTKKKRGWPRGAAPTSRQIRWLGLSGEFMYRLDLPRRRHATPTVLPLLLFQPIWLHKLYYISFLNVQPPGSRKNLDSRCPGFQCSFATTACSFIYRRESQLTRNSPGFWIVSLFSNRIIRQQVSDIMVNGSLTTRSYSAPSVTFTERFSKTIFSFLISFHLKHPKFKMIYP